VATNRFHKAIARSTTSLVTPGVSRIKRPTNATKAALVSEVAACQNSLQELVIDVDDAAEVEHRRVFPDLRPRITEPWPTIRD
jgi:hypothetical protein